jgi:hypothetical protein
MHRGLALAVAALCLLVAGPSALADSTELLQNGTFEGSGSGSLAGWTSQNAALSLVTGDGGGFGAREAWTGAGTSYGITTSPNPVTGTASTATVYTAAGRFNAPTGKSVCLKVKESGSQSNTVTACATGTGAWRDLPPIAYTPLADGDTLNVTVIQKTPVNGDAFVVDNLTFTTPTAGTISPPANLSATAVSASEVDLDWDASPTSGITGYHVYRDGGSTPIATVNAPATSFPDTTVAAATTYTYTVTAFDDTSESDPSNQASATTPGGGPENLISNGTFEGTGSGSLSGWKGQDATLSLAAGDGGGFAARQAWTGAGTSYGITTKPNPVNGTAIAGAVYTAGGRFNASTGRSVCLKVKESGAQPQTVTACAGGNGGWKDLPVVDYTALANGDTLNVTVIQKTPASGNAFLVDNLTLETEPVEVISPPANLDADAVSSTEIDLTWDPSATGGITGYRVYQNGGGTPIATVDAPDTTYQDTTVSPGTTYTYTVTAFDPTAESDPSNQATATTPGGSGSVTLAVAGDIACHPNDPDFNGGLGQNGSCQQAATAALIGQGSYDKVLALGDLQYDCASLGAFNASFDLSWGQYDAKMEPVLGNHEVQGHSGDNETGCSRSATGYYTYFANHGVTDAAGVNGQGYYSYDIGGWHVLAINANCDTIGGCDTGDPEEAWVRADLAAHPNQCTLAYWHQAAWSTTGDDKGVPNMRPIWADLANAGIELVLNGHFHHYERFADLDASGQPVPDGTGTREIIAGIGGESQGGFGSKTPLPGSQVRAEGYGILALTLSSGSYSWEYRQVGGTIGDQGADVCHL